MADGKVGFGHPLSKLNGQSLSAEDEKSVDELGNRVINGKPWSTVPTGLYLTIFGYRGKRLLVKGTHTRLPGDLVITVHAGEGKPKMPVEGWGASLELPADLGRDDLKKQYVTEWVIETTKEVLNGAEGYIPDNWVSGFAAWLNTAAEAEIRSTGL